MGKRKYDDSAAEQAVSKKPKRDKSKYTKNVDPNMTKAERKEARRVAKMKRKAERSKIRKEKLAEAAANAPKEEIVKPDEVPADLNADFIPLGGEDEEKQPAGPNAKARRKAARKIEQEAEKARKAEEKAARKQKAKAARATQTNGVPKAAGAEEAEENIEAAVEAMDVSEDAAAADNVSDSDSVIKTNGVTEKAVAKDPIPEDNDADAPVETAPPAKTQKKEKKDKKQKKQKAESATDAASSAPTTNGHADSDLGSGYTENAALAGLPDAEVQSYLDSKQITVKDADQQLRPIMSFDYLPQMEKSSFKNFSAPTPIQAATWPYLLAGRDVIGVAETGSGKTLAFGVPCIYRLAALSKRKHIKACVVSPTRELALQIQDQLSKFGEPFGIKVACVYGGVPKDAQRATLKGASIAVATPGRLNDFLQEGSIDLSHADYLVLDEADRMLDTGFEQEVRKIASSTAQEGRQTLMFTATWPQSVRDLAATFMSKPVRILIGETTGELRANTRIVQEVEVIDQRDKQQRLFQLLKQYQSGKNKSDRILVFCLYKKEATRIEEFIRFKGFNVAGIHGDLSQQKRTESLEAFKNGSVPLLVATDVAARGLDIPAVKLVINVTFPLTVEDYVHRIGRTGRAGQDGRAITLFTDAEKGLAGALINVLKAANQPVPEELLKFGTTVKKKGHDAYGAFYKDTTDMKKATKITFD